MEYMYYICIAWKVIIISMPQLLLYLLLVCHDYILIKIS